jgi:signal transduction histidine kinase
MRHSQGISYFLLIPMLIFVSFQLFCNVMMLKEMSTAKLWRFYLNGSLASGTFLLLLLSAAWLLRQRALPSHLTDFSKLIHNLSAGIAVLDAQARIVVLNDRFADLSGQKRSKCLKQPIDKVLAIPDLDIRSGEAQRLLFDMPRESDPALRLQIISVPLSKGTIVILEDLTAERDLQEAIRRTGQLETVSQMAASVAHEVRNPMTSVQGFLQLMNREIHPSHAHAMYLQVMEEDLKRISTIITEYLNLSRMSSGGLEEVSLNSLLQNTCALLRSEANLRGIQITLELPEKSPCITVDPNSIKQVLINLVRNALEAIGKEPGVVMIALEDHGQSVMLKIKDTGPGIPAHDLSRIFNPYFTTKQNGTGLGLPISKRIIEELGGQMTVQTEEGKGTTFFLRLPKHPFST